MRWVLVAAVVVVLGLGGWFVYTSTGEASGADLQAAQAAHENSDCVAAVAGYEQVLANPRALQDPHDRVIVETDLRQCRAFLDAEQLMADGDWNAAEQAFSALADEGTVNQLRVEERRDEAAARAADVDLANGEAVLRPLISGGEFDPAQVDDAVRRLVAIVRAPEPVPAAPQATPLLAQAFDPAVTRLLGGGHICEASSVLTDYASAVEVPELAVFTQRLDELRPQLLNDCGVRSLAEGYGYNAAREFRLLLQGYPDHPLAAEAQDGVAAGEIAGRREGAVTGLPALVAVGEAPEGTSTVEVVNRSGLQLEVRVAGPVDVIDQVFGCGRCWYDPAVGPIETCGTADEPRTTLELEPGTYQAVVDNPRRSGTAQDGDWQLEEGVAYRVCFANEETLDSELDLPRSPALD